MKTQTVQKSRASGTFHVLGFFLLLFIAPFNQIFSPLSVQRNETTWFNRQNLVSLTPANDLVRIRSACLSPVKSLCVRLAKSILHYSKQGKGGKAASRRSRNHARSLQGLSCLTQALMTVQPCFTLLSQHPCQLQALFKLLGWGAAKVQPKEG